MFIDMLNHPEFMTFDLSSLSTGIMAGSPCPVETMKQVVEKMHMDQVTVNIFLSFLMQAEQFYSFWTSSEHKGRLGRFKSILSCSKLDVLLEREHTFLTLFYCVCQFV